MNHLRKLIVLLLFTCVSLQGAALADALHLQGVVLSVDQAKRELIVRHEPFGGMPGMTMPFRISPESAIGAIHPGDAIAAEVDESTDPWTLSRIIAKPGIELTNPTSALRSVHQLAVGEQVPPTRFIDERRQPCTFAGFRGKTCAVVYLHALPAMHGCVRSVSANFHTCSRRSRAVRTIWSRSRSIPISTRPEVLEAYARRFDADESLWTLGTGPRENVLNFAASFGIARSTIRASD